MADIEESQSRIAAALSRIDAGVDALQAQSAQAADTGELDALRAALEEEKLVSAQLEERIRKLKSTHEMALEAARAAAAPAVPVAEVDAELQKLKQVIRQLRENNQALREANETGVTEPHLINKSMLTELEALRAERAADVAETSAILKALEPMLADQKEGV